MYMDSVILFSLLIIVLTCAIVIYLSIYTLKHMRKDVAAFEGKLLRERTRNEGGQQLSDRNKIDND